MSLIQNIFAAGIRATDVLNKINDPFPAFDRPAIPKTARSLKDLERDFYSDLVNNFWVCDGQVLAGRLPLPAGSPIDTGDQAIWHGVYTAMLALRYNAVGDVVLQANTYAALVDAAKGLLLHQTIHKEAKPRLIRGVSDDLKTWQDDVSNDSATGHILGIYFGARYGPATMRPVFAQLAYGLAAELHNHGHALVRADGTPTTYGALESGWKTDPLRITLALAIYAVAATLCKEPQFMQDYSDLYQRYKPILAYPKVKLWWIDTVYDTHRAAIHLALLADLTTGDANMVYIEGLQRIKDMVRKEGNIWVNALCCFGMGTMHLPDNERVDALKVLSEFDLESKQSNPGRDNYELIKQALDAGKTMMLWPNGQTWMPKPVLWNGTWMANQPLPRWVARSQDFFWQRNLRSLDVGSAAAQPDSRLNGGDFLAAYWLSRVNGTLNEND